MDGRDLLDLRATLQRQGIIFAFSGYMTEAMLGGVGEAIKQKLTIDDADSKTQTWALVTDVLMAATAVSAGVSLYLTLKPPSGGGEEAGQTTLVIQPRGVSARVSF